MDTEKKFGLPKWKAIALFCQFVLIVLATVCTGYVLWFSVSHNTGAIFIAAYVVVLISYVAIIFYAAYGRNKDDSYYLGAVYAFCAAILLNVLLPFRTTYQMITLIGLFGIYIAFAQRLKQVNVAEWLLLCAFVFAIAFSVYSTVTARVDNLGELSNNLFSVSAMYISIWTPVIMTVTLALAYNVRQRN